MPKRARNSVEGADDGAVLRFLTLLLYTFSPTCAILKGSKITEGNFLLPIERSICVPDSR
jgi:hypothetical protein